MVDSVEEPTQAPVTDRVTRLLSKPRPQPVRAKVIYPDRVSYIMRSGR